MLASYTASDLQSASSLCYPPKMPVRVKLLKSAEVWEISNSCNSNSKDRDVVCPRRLVDGFLSFFVSAFVLVGTETQPACRSASEPRTGKPISTRPVLRSRPRILPNGLDNSAGRDPRKLLDSPSSSSRFVIIIILKSRPSKSLSQLLPLSVKPLTFALCFLVPLARGVSSHQANKKTNICLRVRFLNQTKL